MRLWVMSNKRRPMSPPRHDGYAANESCRLSDPEFVAGSDSAPRLVVGRRAARGIIYLMLWIVAVSPAFAETHFESKRDVGQWMTFYYQKPQPDRIPDAVNYLSESGMLDDENAYSPIFGFLSGVFRDNPDKMARWVTQLNSLKEEHFFVLILGVRYAALSESQETIRAILEQHGVVSPNRRNLSSSPDRQLLGL